MVQEDFHPFHSKRVKELISHHCLDDNGHGTHMAGCIAQTTNNFLGVAGVAYAATILPVKIMDHAGSVSISDEVDGIYYAVNNGAHIINLNLGGEGTSVT